MRPRLSFRPHRHPGVLAPLLAALAPLAGCATETPSSVLDEIDASLYFPIDPGRMWQFRVEGAGDELGYTFFMLGEEEILEGGASAVPMVIAQGTDERTAEIDAIVLLSQGGGWVNLLGERDVESGADSLYDVPVALGRGQWKVGETVSTAASADGSLEFTATLTEIADHPVYYGTFEDAARVELAGTQDASPLAGTWWWGNGVGPCHFTPAAEGSLAIELVYYEP